MIIVTGAAGFIGSNLVRALNARGERDIVLVDRLDSTAKFRNLSHLSFEDIVTPEEFLENIKQYNAAEVVFHQGALSTATRDGALMMRANYAFSRDLFQWCRSRGRRLIYASSAAVYGTGKQGFAPSGRREDPLNVYGFSKLAFDRYLGRQSLTAQVAGLRYFNVYGPGEAHKEQMASVPWHLMNQARDNGCMRIFAGSERFFRDFIYIDDVIRINLFFLDNPNISGLFNAGTGTARSFADLGQILTTLIPQVTLETIAFPEDLKGHYQKYTCADIMSLTEAGFAEARITLEDGLKDYYHHFVHHEGLRPSPESA